jgi:hypothetical protein
VGVGGFAGVTPEYVGGPVDGRIVSGLWPNSPAPTKVEVAFEGRRYLYLAGDDDNLYFQKEL